MKKFRIIYLFGLSVFFLFSCTPLSHNEKESDLPQKVFINNSNFKYLKELPNAGEHMYAFSKYAKAGKITLFITSASWCAPCKVLTQNLEEAFENGRIDNEHVEVFILKFRGNLKQMNTQRGYQMLKEIDLLTKEFPTTYICSPTTNCFNVIKGNKLEEILDDIDFLNEARIKYFNNNYLITTRESETYTSNQTETNYQYDNQQNTNQDSKGSLIKKIILDMNNENTIRMVINFENKLTKDESNIFFSKILQDKKTIYIQDADLYIHNLDLDLDLENIFYINGSNLGFIPMIWNDGKKYRY